MELKNLQTFIQAAELGSFTKAGQQLGFSQSTVSFQIRQLESELNAQLFERIGHTVTLTALGRETLSYAHQILQLAREMGEHSQTKTAVSGHIRLGTADSICFHFLREQYQQFRQLYPNITLKVIPAGTEEMFRMLDHNEVDLICTLDNHIYDTQYIIAQEEKICIHFVVSSDSPLAKKGSLTLEELIGHPFILTEKGMSYRRMLDEALASRFLEVSPILEIGNTDMICHLVAHGIGLSFLPDYATQSAFERGELVRLPVPELELHVWTQLLYHRGKWLSPAINALIDYLT